MGFSLKKNIIKVGMVLVNRGIAIILAIICGICAGIQPPINAGLGKVINSKNATLVSLAGSIILILFIVLTTGNIKDVTKITSVSPLYWIGGIFGVIVIFTSLTVIPVLGATATYSVIVSFQLVVGAVINQFGLFGVTRSPITLTKVLGIGFLILGVKFILS